MTFEAPSNTSPSVTLRFCDTNSAILVAPLLGIIGDILPPH